MKFRITVSNVRHHSGFILFQIIYIAQEAWVFRKSKPSWKYCLEIANQFATLKFKKFILISHWRTEDDVTLIWKHLTVSHHFLDSPFSDVSFSFAVEN